MKRQVDRTTNWGCFFAAARVSRRTNLSTCPDRRVARGLALQPYRTIAYGRAWRFDGAHARTAPADRPAENHARGNAIIRRSRHAGILRRLQMRPPRKDQWRSM